MPPAEHDRSLSYLIKFIEGVYGLRTDQGDKCNSLAAWDRVCHPKNKGGLGVINLKVQSDALLLKYLHKFYNHTPIPWVELIWSTYFNNKIPHASDPCGSFWWTDIMKLMPMYRGMTKVKVMDGTNTLFWKDMWANNILIEQYPRAYSFAIDEDVSIKDFLAITSLSMAFHTPLSPQAFDEVRNMQADTALVTTSSSQGNDK